MRQSPAPVEYAVAIESYLAAAGLSPASRRVYRISLTGWAWAFVGQSAPAGRGRRSAVPPVVPLALLDRPETRGLLASAFARRAITADARTVNRELSVLRSAVAWWLRQGWIAADPTASVSALDRPDIGAGLLSDRERAAVFALPAPLREQAFWHVLHDTAEPATVILRLDADAVHLAARQLRLGQELHTLLPATARLLGWQLAGRRHGPAFLTTRRAPPGTARADICPLTGRGRLSYRRAAEVFATATRPLDPAGRGWMLHQLRGRPHA